MQVLLTLSRAVDRLSRLVGRYVIWLILASTLISAGNAVVRKVLHTSSNALLEVQWYLFAAAFLLAAAYTLLDNEHVRIDVLSARLSARARAWIDLIGFAFFVAPICGVMLWYGVPFFLQGWASGEMSPHAGGLARWPVYAMIPLGFGLLLLQGLSELIKRIAFLRGLIDDPNVKAVAPSAEQALAETLRQPVPPHAGRPD